jgi:dodecin
VRSAPVASGGNLSEQQDHVPGAVVRISEIVGSSPHSFSDAVRNAVRAAAETVRGIRGVEVISSNADVDENGNLSLYKVNCKIAFVVERSTS